MLFFEKIKYQISRFLRIIKLPKFSVINLFGLGIMLLFGVSLSVSIYNSFNNGMATINSFHDEEVKLQQLQAENKQLKQQVDEYNSLDYKKIYARENLNLGEKNETLYYVDRPVDLNNIEQLPQAQMSITLQDNISYWKKLLLGL